MTIQDFLFWILNSGGGAVILSFILERVPQYQALEAELKKLAFFVGSAVVALAAYSILTYVPKETLDMLAPWFGILYSVFAANFAGEVFHRYDKLNK